MRLSPQTLFPTCEPPQARLLIENEMRSGKIASYRKTSTYDFRDLNEFPLVRNVTLLVFLAGLMMVCSVSYVQSTFPDGPILQPSAPQIREPAAKTLDAPKPEASLEQAKSLLQKGKIKEAEAVTRQFLKSHADSAAGHFLLGYILFDEIHEKYLGQQEHEGESFQYNDEVGEPLARLRDRKARESLAEFTAGARYHVPEAFDLKIVALDYVLLGDNIAADKWLRQSLRRESKDAQAWYYFGRVKYSESQFPQAIEAFEQCLELDPRNILAEYNVGLSYEGLGQKDEAIQAYQNAITWEAQSEVKSPEPFVGLARLYLDENQPEKAVPYLLQASAAFPQASQVHETLGRAYSVLHQLPSAQQELEKAVQLSPEKAPVRCMLGQVYRQEGMIAKAQAEFNHCAALQKIEPSGHRTMK